MLPAGCVRSVCIMGAHCQMRACQGHILHVYKAHNSFKEGGRGGRGEKGGQDLAKSDTLSLSLSLSIYIYAVR